MAAFTKGHTKVGGRKRGTPNRLGPRKAGKLIFGDDFRAAMMEEIRATPLEIMHAVMMLRASKGDYDGALTAAEKMAPYVHARSNAAEVRVSHSLASRSDAELAADIDMLRQKLTAAKEQQAGSGPLIDLQPEPAVPLRPDADAPSSIAVTPDRTAPGER
jgi:hypothetical protein